MQFGVQLYGLRDRLHSSPEAVFEGLAKMGYSLIEPCVCFGDFDRGVLWNEQDYETNRPLWEKHGLTVSSFHALYREMDIPVICQFAKRAGVGQVVLNCPEFQDAEAALHYAKDCMQLADALKEHGIQLMIHNSRHASAQRIEGKSAYEFVLDACGDGVYAQPDIGWLDYGKVDPSAFLWRYEKQVLSLHYQPLDEDEAVACYQFARANGVIQIMDQDEDNGTIMDDMQAAINRLNDFAQRRDQSSSILCVMDVETGEVTELQRFDRIIEAPNWVQGAEQLIYNADGKLYRYDIASASETLIDTGSCDNCNNDHVLSPDGKNVAVSHAIKPSWMSKIYVVSLDGGEPRLVTPKLPSFLHGWSFDGKELAYCAFREHDGVQQVDVYAIDASGSGEERRITQGEGFSDGPEYAPDDKTIWFNGTRSGLMQVWRMDRDGKNPTQMTDADSNNWFPHVSPDGKQVVYLSYRKGELNPSQHLPNMHVALWLMDVDGSNKRKILSFFGGQGSINVNSWAADSKRFAFVKYELHHR
ncbi:hypothetical protein LJC33_02660 [Eubacteriales bacterium OttesenSCG-928-N13]|nr:hypothetical protein [Eubacteriales bacterium OttesenSCG-928-N13]